VRQRNLVFTGLTRAKGWVRITGTGESAAAFVAELNHARSKYPYLEFTYPTEADFRVMKRDLEAAAAHRVEMERLLEHFSIEDLEGVIASRKAKTPRKPKK